MKEFSPRNSCGLMWVVHQSSVSTCDTIRSWRHVVVDCWRWGWRSWGCGVLLLLLPTPVPDGKPHRFESWSPGHMVPSELQTLIQDAKEKTGNHWTWKFSIQNMKSFASQRCRTGAEGRRPSRFLELLNPHFHRPKLLKYLVLLLLIAV